MCCSPVGHETTATTTAAALYCISVHPAVEQQVLQELQAVLGDRPPRYDDLEHLPYLQVGLVLSCFVISWVAFFVAETKKINASYN